MKYLLALSIIVLPFYGLKERSSSIDPSIKTPKAVMDDFMAQRFGAFTHSGNKLCIHVFEKTSGTLPLPALTNVKLKQAYLLKGEKINCEQGADGAVTLQLPQQLTDCNDPVIVLGLTTSAQSIAVVS